MKKITCFINLMTPLTKRQKETTTSGPQHFLIEKLVQNKEIASFVCCLSVGVTSLPYNAISANYFISYYIK